MWQNLTPAQIEDAKNKLKLQREQMLIRHAAEIRDLDAELSEIAMLGKMVAAFAQKFKIGLASPSAAAVPGEREGNGQDLGDACSALGVSFFITQAQKSKLRELGIADQQIRDMKPSEAHKILGLSG